MSSCWSFFSRRLSSGGRWCRAVWNCSIACSACFFRFPSSFFLDWNARSYSSFAAEKKNLNFFSEIVQTPVEQYASWESYPGDSKERRSIGLPSANSRRFVLSRSNLYFGIFVESRGRLFRLATWESIRPTLSTRTLIP